MTENICTVLFALYPFFLAVSILSAQEANLQKAKELNAQIVQLYQQGKYAEAIPLAQEALRIREQALGPDHPDVAASLTNLALLYKEMGAYGQAEPLYQRALKIDEKASGLDHPDVATDLNNLALLYEEMGAYGQAEPLLQRALKIDEKTSGKDHPDVATDLNSLALLYYKIGDYSKAEPLFQRALKIREAKLGPDHPNVATSLNNLAELYRAMGEYGQAELLFQRALKIREAQLGPNHQDLASSLNNLAFLYHNMGAYGKAEPLYQQALKIFEAKLGPDHPDVATSLNNLAGLYNDMNAYGHAESLYQRALKIREAQLGPDHPNVATSLNDLAGLYYKMGAHSQAESLYQRALKIFETKLGPNHPDVATSLNNLAAFYYITDSYTEAEPLCKQALSIRAKVLGPEHPVTVQSLNNLALLWVAIGKIDSTLSIAKRVAGAEFNLYHRYLPYLSEKRQLEFIKKYPSLSGQWPSLYLQHGAKYRDLESLTSEVLINNKGLTLEVLTARARKIKSGDKSIAVLKDSLNDISARLANLYLSDPAPGKSVEHRMKDIQSLNREQQRLEDELAAKGYSIESKKSPITATQVAQVLHQDYALLDFWFFQEYVLSGEKKRLGKWRYLTVVYQPQKETKLIDLGEADPIHKSIAELKSSILVGKLDTTKSIQQQAEALVKAKSKELWQQLFKPLLPAIGEKKKVIICADGALHYLPFGVLVDEQNRYLVESYQFHYVSTSREILQWKASSKSASGKLSEAVIIADPQFDFAPTQKVASVASSKSFAIEFSDRRSRDWRQMNFNPLKYTGPEAVAIDSLLKQKGIATKLYLQNQAQESVLKSVVSPQILHISTHGFFLPDQPELRKPKEISGFSSIGEFDRTPALENPLLRCGLAFAGANHAEAVKEGEDGLATAMEIAGLDLQGTDLVTLSACLTGVGELKSGEGVYGLHRSFLLAGAKTVLASLWSVPDLETKDLMVEFYRRYLFGENISKSEALRQAQLAVIEQLRKKYGAAPPAYWGAFVCIGEP